MARSASLLAIAAVPVVAGLDGSVFHEPAAFDAGYRSALLICAAMFGVGAALAAAAITNPAGSRGTPSPPLPPTAGMRGGGRPHTDLEPHVRWDGRVERDGDAVV